MGDVPDLFPSCCPLEPEEAAEAPAQYGFVVFDTKLSAEQQM